jgi:hypothetical protein
MRAVVAPPIPLAQALPRLHCVQPTGGPCAPVCHRPYPRRAWWLPKVWPLRVKPLGVCAPGLSSPKRLQRPRAPSRTLTLPRVARPIEVHAHDPLRYLGDMLAWIHQSIATEREIANGLFGPAASESKAGEGTCSSKLFCQLSFSTAA